MVLNEEVKATMGVDLADILERFQEIHSSCYKDYLHQQKDN